MGYEVKESMGRCLMWQLGGRCALARGHTGSHVLPFGARTDLGERLATPRNMFYGDGATPAAVSDLLKRIETLTVERDHLRAELNLIGEQAVNGYIALQNKRTCPCKSRCDYNVLEDRCTDRCRCDLGSAAPDAEQPRAQSIFAPLAEAWGYQVSKDVPVKENDHGMDALRYVVGQPRVSDLLKRIETLSRALDDQAALAASMQTRIHGLEKAAGLGDSTRSEIAYAEAHGKPVRYWSAPVSGSDTTGDGEDRG